MPLNPQPSTLNPSPRELQFLRVWQIVTSALRLPPSALPPAPVTQHLFHETRKWRFDFAWPAERVAVEIHGGTRGKPVVCHACGAKVRMRTAGGRPGKQIMLGGRHNSTTGLHADREKINAAVDLCWRVYEITTQQLDEQPVQTVERIVRALALKPEWN